MVLNYSKRHDFCRGWSVINTISPEHGVLSFITMISPEDGLPSPWFLHRMVYHHHLSRGWSIITMISAEDGLSSPYLHVMVHQWSIITSISIWWSIITMISQVEGLSTWSIKKRVYHHHDLSRGGSIITMISPEGLSWTWSLQRRVYHQHDLSRGWSFNHHCCPTTRMVPGCLYWARWSVPWPGLSSCPWVWPLLPRMSPAPAAAAAPLAACALRTENSYTTLVLFPPWLSSARSSFTFTVSDQ